MLLQEAEPLHILACGFCSQQSLFILAARLPLTQSCQTNRISHTHEFSVFSPLFIHFLPHPPPNKTKQIWERRKPRCSSFWARSRCSPKLVLVHSPHHTSLCPDNGIFHRVPQLCCQVCLGATKFELSSNGGQGWWHRQGCDWLAHAHQTGFQQVHGFT